MFRSVYSYVCHTWIFIVLITIVYLYFKGAKPHKHKYNQEFCTKAPSKLTLAELSTLMYQSITSTTFCAEVIKLFNDGVLLTERKEGFDYIIRNPITTKFLSRSEEYTVRILLNVMGDGTAMKLDKDNLFAENKQNCRQLYNEYKIWCRITRKESMGKNFYEYKTQYVFVKFLTLIGAILFILNIFLKYYHLFGTASILLAMLLTLYFSKIFKRTIDGNEQYQEWLAFKRYLEEIENFDIEIEDKNEYIMYGIILNVPYVEEKLTNNNFFGGLIEIIDTNIVNAIIKGKR